LKKKQDNRVLSGVNSLKNLLMSHYLTKGLILNLKNIRRYPPVIIYQMGKVGSTALLESLQTTDIPNMVYSAHFLSHKGMDDAEKYFLSQSKPTIPNHLKFSRLLRRKIDKTKGICWKIITLVRDPVGREISDFFQNVEFIYPEFVNETGYVKKDAALNFIIEQFKKFEESSDYANNWLDNEIKDTFDVDVYQHFFDVEKGFTIIKEQGVEILLLKMEDMYQCIKTALSEFLDLKEPFVLKRSNIGSEKKYSAIYKYVKENIIIPREICERIYSTKYARHFFSDNMREKLLRRWSEKL